MKNTYKSAKALALHLAANSLTPVFDLDGVCIDATARQLTKDDGSLDLEHYRENSTAEKIAQDKELPLMSVMREYSARGKPFHIATARVMCEHTQDWLKRRGIRPHSVMARDGEADTRRDYQLKTDKLTAAFSDSQRAKMVLIDDNHANIQAAKAMGMKAIHVPFQGH